MPNGGGANAHRLALASYLEPAAYKSHLVLFGLQKGLGPLPARPCSSRSLLRVQGVDKAWETQRIGVYIDYTPSCPGSSWLPTRSTASRLGFLAKMSGEYQDKEKHAGSGPESGSVEVYAGEVFDTNRKFDEVGMVKQGLKQRHIQMIALAGTIGTGLFLGSGRAIAHGGPLGAFLGYLIIGITASGVVLAVAEMGALLPLNGGIVRYTDTFVDPALAFANGWNSIYSSIVSLPAEIVAAAVLVEFWVTVSSAIVRLNPVPPSQTQNHTVLIPSSP